jgi:prepilin-type N-terminal cleavage/methylation domain-containing protein
MPSRRGFTLVELMVSLALLGLVMTIVFSLFSTTSDGLKEADSLVDTLDRARFAMSRISSEVKSAGSFSTPDSQNDKWVIQNGANDLCVFGVAGYQGWQNSTTQLTDAGLEDAHDGDGDASTADVSYDGLIVMGALDFSQTFEVSNFVFGSVTTALIPDHAGGVGTLLANNLFYTEATAPSAAQAAQKTALVAGLQNRLIRVADRDGNLQFREISLAAEATNGITLTLKPALQVREGGRLKGLQRQTLGAQDIGYEASLVDAYWYHVVPDPRDPTNFRLVRDRLDAAAIAAELCTPASATPADNTVGPRVVITDRVVDFQVWFDCAGGNGSVQNATWVTQWASPDGNGNNGDAAGDGCMNVSSPNFGAARMAHIRLSVRTRDERKDAPDAPDALFMDETGAFSPTVALRYFNVYPDAPGAARVVTVQSDVELSTFAMRNISF